MTRGRFQHLAPPWKLEEHKNWFTLLWSRFEGEHQTAFFIVLRSLTSSSWKRPPGGRRKFRTEVVKEDLRILGVDRQFRRDVRFRRMWNSDEWIDSAQESHRRSRMLAEQCSRTAHLGEDTGNRVRR
ncbi:hypothetical protein RB195_022795 [Necator americanus]|uniref:Uncharacterized protein n=1 Tax=Necator americanus TaxID=51031 RepID=A0ABR1EGW8_NECAM